MHLNRTNLGIHFVCVPHIMWSVFVLLSLKSWPVKMMGGEIEITLEKCLFYGIWPYYLALKWDIALGFFIFALPMHMHVLTFRDHEFAG